MFDATVLSNLLLWLVVIALAVAVLALARQIGVLHERIRPVGALALGQAVQAGDAAPQLTLSSITGGVTTIGGPSADGRATLLFFLSPTCPVCKTLLPVVRALVNEESNVRLVLASDGDQQKHERFIGQYQLGSLPYLLSTQLGVSFRIGKLPYAVLIGGDGKVHAQGLVNTREHLESLFEARRLGVGTIQAFHAAAGARA